MASTGLTVALIKALGGGIDPSAVEQAVADWLDEHPEAVQTDVQINGTSIVSSGVANIPVASSSTYGVAKTDAVFGTGVFEGKIFISGAGDNHIKDPTISGSSYKPITPYNQHKSVYYALAKAAGADMKNVSGETVGTYPEAQKSAISDMLNAPESVSGSTPSITAKSGVRYICGECSTLSITAPASGCIDVLFESGSTPTVLTVSSAKSGVSAIKWIGADDPTALEANKTYEINILDGEFGVIASWT